MEGYCVFAFVHLSSESVEDESVEDESVEDESTAGIQTVNGAVTLVQ